MKLLPRRASRPEPTDSPKTGPSSAAQQTTDPRRAPGKGRPTPKRRDAQGKRSGPVPPPPKTRREAYRRLRGKNSGRRQEIREGMKAGDERYLSARDRGPAKALARDIVDARRNVGSLFMVAALVVLLSYAIPSSSVRSMAMLGWMAIFVLIIIDSFILRIQITRALNERLPQESSRGVGWYGIQRALMIRRWRMPKPRVRPGDSI